MSPTLNFRPHERFWFDDGNIILVARDVGFKIYRGLLAINSTVFSDMLASSSASKDDIHDGCPIVTLSETPQEWAHFLAVFIPTPNKLFSFCRREGDPKYSFDQISAMVRLAHKYGVQAVQDQAIFCLRQSYYTNSSDLYIEEGTKGGDIDIKLVHAIGVVNLARLTGTTSILPVALYDCCRMGEKLLDGWTRDDGEVEYLSVADAKLCFMARERLAVEGYKRFIKIFDARSQNCKTHHDCPPRLREFISSVARDTWSIPLRPLTALADYKSDIPAIIKARNVCSECGKELKKRSDAEREKIWKRLPEIFGIVVPDWNGAPPE